MSAWPEISLWTVERDYPPPLKINTVVPRYGKSSRLTQSLNNSLAFFLFELLSIADRGHVLSLVRGYCKQMSAKIASLPQPAPLVHYKVSCRAVPTAVTCCLHTLCLSAYRSF